MVNYQKIIVRHDDFDFRMSKEEYIAIHEQFIKMELIETACLIFAIDGRKFTINPEIIDYLKSAPNWDLQLHGWAHEHYDKYSKDEIRKDLDLADAEFKKLFGDLPKVWYPPWNCRGPEMDEVAQEFGLEINNESYDIAKFIREVKDKTYTGHSIYFHGYKKDEMELFPEMLKLVKEICLKDETT